MNGARHRFALGLTCFFLICVTVVYPFPAVYAECVCQLGGGSGISKPQWEP